MTKWKELKQQILAGTKVDLQGESNTKEFLVSLKDVFNARGRIPLGQHHDLSKEAVGYIENFDVLPDKSDDNHWNLVGDVYFHDVEIDSALKGFSYSANIDMAGDVSNKDVAIYVPFPYYNSEELAQEITGIGEGISFGAWKKKNASPDYVSLVMSLVLFAAAPVYTNFWFAKISPALSKLRSRLGKDHSADFIQVGKGHLGETYGIYFVPERGDEENCFVVDKIVAGIELVNRHLESDELAKEKGVHIAKLIYSSASNSFELASIEYIDGSVVKHRS